MQTYRFGDFELDLDALQLRRHGTAVRLERRPLDLLILLVRRHGRMVPREEIIATLWPARVIIEFDSGLNTLVHKVRSALGDSSDHPRFIETVPGRGYRFIAAVSGPEEAASIPVSPAEAITVPSRRPSLVAASLGLAVAAVVAVLLWQSFLQSADVSEREAVATAAAGGGIPEAAGITLAVMPLRSTTGSEADVLLAESVTDLIRNRLATLGGLTVVASGSVTRLADPDADLRSVGERLQARLLLRGDAQQTGERLQLAVELVDAPSGRQIWSAVYDRPLAEIAAAGEEIVLEVGGLLDIPVDATASHRFAQSEISLEAYRLYLQGRRLLANSTAADTQRALELFRRATILDPDLARAYVGLGQALLQLDVNARASARFLPMPEVDVASASTPAVRAQAVSAFDRALALSPALGEAWIEHARLTRDPLEAEVRYRKGLELAPSYGSGYVRYATFLFRHGRMGEAIETIGRARRIDPLTPELHMLHAFFLMVVRSDLAGHDRLLREALEINPRHPGVLHQLAHSRWEYSGALADAAQLAERAVAADPEWALSRTLARDIYLDLHDPAAATAVLGDALPPAAAMEIAQYEGDRIRAAALLEDRLPEDWQDTGTRASMTEAVRDGAIASGDLEPALKRLESVFASWERDPPMWQRAASIVYAHTLVLAGDVERGHRLAEATLAVLDTHSIGRAENWFSRERAAAFAVLGEDDLALDQLAVSVANGWLYRWWYLAEHDPLYERLRLDPRFQAINEQARLHIDRQRAALEEMRRDGQIPRRSLDAAVIP